MDRAIPYALILLAGIIIINIFFKEFAEHYALYLEIGDYAIISLFIVDLGFKYNRIRNFKTFFKECWIDIIAVFPFVLVFRLVEEVVFLARFSAEVKEGQSILHTIVQGREEFAKLFGESEKLIKEAEAAGKISRTERVLRIMRPVARAPRLVKAIPFYEKPTGKHHLHELEEVEDVEKDVKKAEKTVEKDFRKLKKNLKKCYR